MEKEIAKWEEFIRKLIEGKKPEVKEKVIKASEFLSFLGNQEEWEDRSIAFSSNDIEKYFKKREIQDNVIDPKLMFFLISGDKGYEFAEKWISEEMLDKSFEHFARVGIDKNFISEICNEKDYSAERLIKKSEKESEDSERVLEWIKKAILEQKNKGIKLKDLILIEGDKLFEIFSLSPFYSQYEQLKTRIGKVVENHHIEELRNKFIFALVNKNDLKFRWIFWGLRHEHNIFNLGTYILLHVWHNVEKEKNFSSNSIIYIKKD